MEAGHDRDFEQDYLTQLAQRLPKTFSGQAPRPLDDREMKTVLKILSDIEVKENSFQKISTSIPDLDDALNGGLSTGNLIEVFGEARTGKTQFCHQMCINVQKPKRLKGLEGEAVYIDGEGTFRPERLLEMAKDINSAWYPSTNPSHFLSRVHLRQIKSPEQAKVLICFGKLEEFISRNPAVKLV